MRLLALDRIIVRSLPNNRVGIPAILSLVLKILAVMRMLPRLRPATLVETNDGKTRLRENETLDCTARTGPDDKDISMFGLAHRVSSKPSRFRSTRWTASVGIQRPRA